MFENQYNPLYSTAPAAPPGLEALTYYLGPILGDLMARYGGVNRVYRPYVPVNLSTADANIAANINDPLYKTMMGGVYGQLGAQLANMAGAMQFVKSFGTMAGYSPAELQRSLSGGIGAFSRSIAGPFVMPFVDMGLSAMGLTGGSMIASAQSVFNARMNLLTPGTLVNPYDAGQQHSAMGAASAVSAMLNAIMSRRADGRLMPGVDQSVMQGFSREEVSQLVMQAAGAGLFSSRNGMGVPGIHHPTGTGGLLSRLTQAVSADGIDLTRLTSEVFDGKPGMSGVSADSIGSIRDLRVEVEQRVRGLTETLGAMRDLTNTVGAEAKHMLDALTNGGWMRSTQGLRETRDTLRTIGAAAKAYNLNPTSIIQQLASNRAVLQDAAGFDSSMISMGFDGGGLFGLAAQTELLLSIEDTINAAGVRNDPVLAARRRRQGVQAYAKNINSTAGRASQILAYARQTGILTQEEAGAIAADLTSGNYGRMDSGLNRLLTTTFGSAEVGRRFMNNTMQMNAMRMAMDGNAGAYATMTTVNGADAEMRNREQYTSAAQRLADAVAALGASGLRTGQAPGDIDGIANAAMRAIRGDGKDATRNAHAAAFGEQYAALRGTHDPRSALSRVMASFNNNPVTAVYAQDIDIAVKTRSAINNEERLRRLGLPGRQAVTLVRALSAAGNISHKEASELYALVRGGNGADALAKAKSVVAGLSGDQQRLYADMLADAATKHNAAMATLDDNAEAMKLLETVSGRGYGGDELAQAYADMAAAGLAYMRDDKDGSYDRFWDRVRQSRFAEMFGPKAWEEYMSFAARGKDKADKKGREKAIAYFSRMGRMSGTFRRIAVDTLGAAGHDITLSGYWGVGPSGASSPAARKERDDLLNQMAALEQRDALEQAGARDPLFQRVLDVMTGDKWERIVNLVDPDDKAGIRSALATYGVSFRNFQEAQAAYNAAMPGWEDDLAALAKSGNHNLVGWLQRKMASGDPIVEWEVRGELSKRGLADWFGDSLMGAVKARNKMLAARRENNAALLRARKDENVRAAMDTVVKYDEATSDRRTLLSDDAVTDAFVRGIDWDPESIAKARSGWRGMSSDPKVRAKKRFLNDLFSLVSDEEVAARKKIMVHKGIHESYGRERLEIAKEKAAQGNESAIALLRSARDAALAGSTRIVGELTIRNGNDSATAVLQAQSLEGGFSQ